MKTASGSKWDNMALHNNLYIRPFIGSNTPDYAHIQKKGYTIYPAADFLKPKKIKLQDLTDKHVVWCKNKEQYDKLSKIQWDRIYKITIKPNEKSAIMAWGGYTVIPFSDLFPKRKKSKTQKKIDALEQRIKVLEDNNTVRINIIDTPYDKETDSYKISAEHILYKGDDLTDVSNPALQPEQQPETISDIIKNSEPVYLKGIHEEQAEVIDWDKPQYFIGINNNVVLSTGKNNIELFSAIILKGEYKSTTQDLLKDLYKPFTGTINIEK